MLIKQLSSNMHWRLLGREAVPMPDHVQKRIERTIAQFFPDGINDPAQIVELQLPSWLPTQPELDTDITALIMPYIDQIMAWMTVDRLPEPSNWDCPVGWSYWGGSSWVPCGQPPKGCRVVDIETVPVTYYQFSKTGAPEPVHWSPVCAIALGIDRVYVWTQEVGLELEVLPLTYPGTPGINIGHNVGYDNSYSLEFHKAYLNDWSERPIGLDTFSLWQVVRGHSNQQRSMVRSEGYQPKWCEETAPASLSDIHQFFFNEELDKGVRDELITLGYSYYCDNKATVLSYCYSDCVATAAVLQALLPEWVRANTYNGEIQWITLWSQLLLSQSWLPLDEELAPIFFSNAEAAYQETQKELTEQVVAVTKALVEEYSELLEFCDANPDDSNAVGYYSKHNAYWNGNRGFTERDAILLSQLDWSPAKSGKNKGLPAWYRSFMASPSYGSRIVPILLGMTWNDNPIVYDNGYHYQQEGKLYPVPNPDKRGKPVHSMFMKDFSNDGVLDARIGALSGDAQQLVEKIHSLTIWTSLRKRVAGLAWEDVNGYPTLKDKLVPWGTITRRSTSNFSQVLPKMDKPGKVGSNPRALVKAPDGYKLVGGDYDSQEALLAAEIGDWDLVTGSVGYRGSSAFSISCHAGDKAAKTTIHWLLALSAGIDYTLAKNINYGVLYGLSLLGIINYFLMANKSMTELEAKQRGQHTLNTMKGVYDRQTGFYSQGSASATFNNLTRLVLSHEPRGLLSHQLMSKPLAMAKGDYHTTKQNWFIQESGSAMRDRLVVYVWYLMLKFGITGRLCMTVHDEAWWMVAEDQAQLMAYILQVAHLYINAWKTLALNLDCLAAGVSYFSSVEVDTRWRKSTKAQAPITPDMPHGSNWSPGQSYTAAMLSQMIAEGVITIPHEAVI